VLREQRPGGNQTGLDRGGRYDAESGSRRYPLESIAIKVLQLGLN
jgi:hypothetical protein